jgi:protocatechuate 3,4-dioxygenase beta subunit
MKKILQTLLISVVVASACSIRAADGQTNDTGTVVDEKGQPVAGATVDCYRYQSRSGFGYWDREPKLEQTTVTDGQGAFAVSASADTTLVVVKKMGLATAWKTWGVNIPDSSDPIVLTAPATLSGMVVDDDGHPVADAEVWVAAANIGDKNDSATQFKELFGTPARTCFSAKTSADGRFRIENFPADGLAGLAVSKTGMARHTIGSEFGGERDCQPSQEIKLVVGPAGSVEGKVLVAETDQPLAGVKIQMDQFGAGVFGSDYYEAVETQADGTFRVSDVQPGKHCIRASIAGGPVPDWVFVPEESQLFTVTAGETVSNVVIHFSKGALVEVTVVVTNELTPVANAAVTSFGSSANTDDHGVALVRSPTGTNWFSARKDWLSQNKKAAVDAGQTNHVQIELTLPPSISGTVRDASGAPATGVQVSFHPGHYPDAPDYAETMTDENGRYELRLKLSRLTEAWDGIITTTNFVMARDLKRNLAAIQEFGTSPTNFNFNGIGAIPTNLDLTLQPGIILTGSVKDTDGNPLTNTWLDLSIEAGNSSSSFKPQPTKVDAQGLFNYPAMPQGRAYYFWGIKAKGYGTAYGFLKSEGSKTNHYEFPAFVLKRADRQLAGQILGSDGKPVVGATVNMSGQGQLMFRETKSDGHGHFIFNGVCAGEIKVDARYYTSPDFRNSEEGDVSAQGGDTNVVVRLGIHSYVYPNSVRNLTPLIKTTGTVSDPSGTPVAGVKMSLFPVQVLTLTSQTDSDGRYEFNWQALLSQEDTQWLLARDPKNGLATIRQLDKTTTNLDLVLQEGITLSTKVSDTEGRLLTNATASVSLRLGNKGFGVDSQPFTADEHGQLRIPALPRGERYMVQIHAPGHTSFMRMIEADETGIKLLELPPVVLTAMDRDVAGLVMDSDGKPAVGVSVHLFQGGGPTTTTDADGHFIFHGVPPGLVSFDAGLPQPGTSAYKNSGMARGKGGDTNIVIRLGTNPDPGSAISQARITTSGTVFDPSGAPAPGALVDVLSVGVLSSPARSDANGKYSLQWQTTLRTNKPVLFVRDPAHNLAATGEIDTNTTSLDLYLQPGLTLAGEVRDSDGRQVTNATVQLVPFPPADPKWGMNRQPPTNASPEGLYFFNTLPQGAPYRVNVSAPGYGTGTVTASGADTQTRQFRLPAIVLNFANQQVAGQVIGLDGKPCWGAEVTVSGDGQPAGRISHSDASGHFVITEVCTGLLNLRADPPGSAVVTVQAHGGDTNVIVKLGR